MVTQLTTMSMFLAIVKAIFTRLVFASHGFIAIWQVTTFKKNPLYWYLCCPIIVLFFEGLFTLTIKENQEWKWFCPSVFLYLCSVVPAIWLLELDKISRRLRMRESNINITDNFDLTNLAAEDLKNLENALGVNIHLPDIQISTETWVTLIEQFLMLILIIGRWMLPKGDLTRDQLSQLLLVYIGTAADIIEFFDSFKEDKISREPMLVYLTLGIWTWSLMQFTVVLTATKSRKSRLSSSNTIKKKLPAETSCCSIDVWGIALNMLLQDGPFLAFRLILIIQYKIVNYMNIFFTCKNTLVILLQLYRLYVVQSETKNKQLKDRSEKYEMPSISIISRSDIYKGTNKRTYKRNYQDEHKRKKRKYLAEDLEKGIDFSESEDISSEELDDYDNSAPLNDLRKSMKLKKNRQDTGYSTSSSRNSSKKSKCRKKDNYEKSDVFGDNKREKKRHERKTAIFDRIEQKGTAMPTVKNRIEKSQSNINRKIKKKPTGGIVNNSSVEEDTENSIEISEISDSEENNKMRRRQHRKRRQERD